jgi:hypothetical protein
MTTRLQTRLLNCAVSGHNPACLTTVPEQPIGPPQPDPSPSSGLRIRPLAVVVVGVLLLFFCAVLWFVIASRTIFFYPRNTPEVLFTGNSFDSLTNLPELSELATNLSVADLAFGEEQMQRMVKDRPEFARHISKEDAIWQFCVRAFTGAAIGEHIVWNNSLPDGDNYRSDNLGPYEGSPGYIQIRKNFASGENRGRPLSCEELWSCAVFELENIRNHKAYMVLYYRALDGKLSREEWIRGCTRLEYDALNRTSKDFVNLWLPLIGTRHITLHKSFWGANIPDTYQGWISLYRDPNSYPWDVYGTYYDHQVVPYVRSTKGFQRVAR